MSFTSWVCGKTAIAFISFLLRACLEALGIIPDVAHVPIERGAPILPEEGRHVIYKQGSELYRTLLGA